MVVRIALIAFSLVAFLVALALSAAMQQPPASLGEAHGMGMLVITLTVIALSLLNLAMSPKDRLCEVFGRKG